jgi:threonylcarbamoyladenosine tRNA methylthiotransferase MtaB
MITAKKVAFHTLGCKLNFSETSTVARQFVEEGYQRTAFSDPADVYVINTCSVTENADKECRELVRRVNRQNPEAFVCITGCYAQLRPAEVASIPGVDLVAGSSEKFNLLPLIGKLQKKAIAEIHSCEAADNAGFIEAFSGTDRTRTFLKVQDGCDFPCTYCTIPKARGRSRSDTIKGILQKVETIVSSGCKEIVLTGVNVGDFGKMAGSERKETFEELIGALNESGHDIRFRISSIEPNLLSPEMIEMVAASKVFMPHFHIPLQSGSNRILGAMRRRYRRELYADRIAYIRSLMPDAGIGADVIVGFPGETDEDFAETHAFIKDLPLSYLHVFTFSARPGTPAFDLPDQVSQEVKQNRNKQLRLLGASKSLAFANKYNGSDFPVLFETEEKDGFLFGYSPNYLRVKLPYSAAFVNTIQLVKLVGVDRHGHTICKTTEVNTINNNSCQKTNTLFQKEQVA